MYFNNFHLEVLDQCKIGRSDFTFVTDGHCFAILEDDTNPNDCDGSLLTASEEFAWDQWKKTKEGKISLWSFNQEG